MKHLIGWNLGYHMIDIDAPVQGHDDVYLRDILPANDALPDEVVEWHEKLYGMTPEAYNLIRTIIEGPETHPEIWRKRKNRVSMEKLGQFVRKKYGWGKEKFKNVLEEIKATLQGDPIAVQVRPKFKRRATV